MADKHYLQAELDERLKSDPEIWNFIKQGSLDGVWYWNLENFEDEWMSPEFWELFGRDPALKKHLASEWQDFIFAEDLETAKENLGKHLADPTCPYDQIVRYTHADGRTIWVRCRGLAIRDENGKPIRLLGAHNDLTSQMLGQQKLMENNAVLDAVLNANSSGVVGLQSDRQIAFINSAARHMLGGISDEVPFDWPQDIYFIDPETLAPVESDFDPIKRILGGDSLANETQLMRRVQAGESHRYVRVESTKLSQTTTGIDVVLIIQDVSQEERNRQVVERSSRLDALGQLTGGIAHDFNNLLASLLYAVDLAGKEKEDAKRTRYLNTATSAIKRGRDLTSRLLAFAKRQPGLAKSRPIQSVFDDFNGLVRPMIEAQFSITFQADDPDLQVFCDQAQLETALMNLVLNSRDAMLRSGVGTRIGLSARPVRSTGEELEARQKSDGEEVDTAESVASQDGSTYRYVEVSITDNGPGMDKETLARSTDPFFTTKNSNSGTGLGLSMVYGFAQQSDGDLRIYSEDSVGTTVQLTLPRGTSLDVREQPVPEVEPIRGHGETILIAEDEPDLLAMQTTVVEGLGYKVISAHSGKDALARITSGETLDLLLSDVVMPGDIGGFELARLARDHLPDLPIIYTSGYTGFTPAQMGSVRAPLLQKPAEPVELAEAIARALGKLNA
ncbi:MAG: PAS domain-containing protein [Devosiaceae bacterium]